MYVCRRRRLLSFVDVAVVFSSVVIGGHSSVRNRKAFLFLTVEDVRRRFALGVRS